MSSNKKTSRESKKSFGKVVDCDLLNVREEPTILSDVVTILMRNAEVTILEKRTVNEWYGVETSTGDRGWVMKEYIAIKDVGGY